MPEENNVSEYLFKADIDQAGLKRIEQGIKNTRQFIRDLAAENKKLDLSGRAGGEGINALAQASQKAQSRLGSLSNSVRINANEFENLQAEARKAGDEAQKAIDKAATAGKGGGRQGLSALGSISQVASIVSPELGQALNFGQDVGESISKLKDLKGGIAEIAPIAGVATIGVVAITAAFAKMQADLEPAKKALEGALAAQSSYYEFIAKGGTSEDAQKRIDELKKLADTQQSIIDENQKALDAAFKDAQATSGDVVARLAFLVGDADDKVGQSTKDAQEKLAAYQGEMARLQAALESGGLAANDTTKAEGELATKRQEAYSQLIKLAQQERDLRNSAAEETIKVNEERRIRDERAQEDFDLQAEVAEKAHQGRLTEINSQGNKRIQDANEQIAKLGESLTEVATKYFADRRKIESDYMRSELAALTKFRADEEKASAQYNKERKRRLEDLNDDLLDAESANDVVRFIAAQKAAEKDLNRQKEDFDDQTKERQAQYDEERAQAQEQLQDRLNQLQDEASARRADIQQQIQERQQARNEIIKDIRDQLAAENARYKEQTDAAQAAFDLRAKRQKEDDDRQDKARAAALQKSLKEIDDKRKAEEVAAGIVRVAWISAANSIAAAARAAASARSSSSSSGSGSGSGGGGSGSGGGSGYTPTAFAFGGVIKKRTIAEMGERPGYHEAVIPYRPSEGLERTLARMGIGGTQIIIQQGNVTVGDIASMSEVRAVIVDENTKLGQAVVNGIARAKAGAA